jgi:hypothetical protein
MPKKKKKPKQKYTKWMLCKVCIKKCCFKWIFIDSFSLFNVYQLCEHLLEQIINDKSNHP